MNFLIFGHAHIFFPFIVVCTHLRCYITSNIHFIMRKEMIQRFSEPKEDRCNILFNVFPIQYTFLFDFLNMYFDHFIKIYASHHYYKTQAT
jgi:hypothetical protein